MKLRDSLFTLAIALPVACQAALVTYDFTVTATTGPSINLTGSGYFTYDDTIVPSGGGVAKGTNLLLDLSFNFDGLSFDEATANTGSLTFDNAGALSSALFGTDCPSATLCFATANEAGFWVSGSGFSYSVVNGSDDTLGFGTTTLTLRGNGVPEPATLGLAALALAAAGACSARGRKGRAQGPA